MKDFYFTDDHFKVCGLYENELKEIFDYEKMHIGRIYRGRIENIDPSLNAAFVNLGEDRNGYLELDFHSVFHEKDELIVQITKQRPGKGPVLTSEISLSHPFFVLFPFSRFKKFSRKLQKREISKLIVATKDILEKYSGGILFRTGSAAVSTEKLNRELKLYVQKANNLRRELGKRPTPKLLYTPDSRMNYYLKSDPVIPWITNDPTFKRKFETVEYRRDFSIQYHPGIWRDYLSLFEKIIPLANGSHIIIEEMEALTAIDVDSASVNGKNNSPNDPYQINIVASREILRQIKLRNLSGIIIIDFLKMKKSHREKFLIDIKKLQRAQNVHLDIYGFTKLGLLECSRVNQGPKLIYKKRRNL
ncbi:MAG: ribonuclease E/G [Tissierellia bacterium]|nr:ribonuclease E/G [Tissierellia bacterium]